MFKVISDKCSQIVYIEHHHRNFRAHFSVHNVSTHIKLAIPYLCDITLMMANDKTLCQELFFASFCE